MVRAQCAGTMRSRPISGHRPGDEFRGDRVDLFRDQVDAVLVVLLTRLSGAGRSLLEGQAGGEVGFPLRAGLRQLIPLIGLAVVVGRGWVPSG